MNTPYDAGREMILQWEKQMAEVIERLTHSEGFLKHMGTAFTQSVDFKKQTEDHFRRYLDTLPMPSKTDMERILAYLLRLETRALDLEDRLARIEDLLTPRTPATAPRAMRRASPPRRTPAKAARPADRAPAQVPAKRPARPAKKKGARR